jgi:glyoxylase-like metal-dependent hydrolase (beta-lactamase superfamily II)
MGSIACSAALRAPVLSVLLMLASGSAAANPFELSWKELAPGVWTGQRPDSPRTPVLGNTTLVISDEGAVVFDGGGAPLASEQVVAKVRELTNQPVTHVIVSHWHGDHDYGIFRILEAFPRAQVLSHPYTRENLAKNSVSEDFLTGYIPTLRERIASKTYSNGQTIEDKDIGRYQDIIDNAELIEQQQRSSILTYPTMTFTDQVTLWSGGREIQLLHLGLSNTAGDVIMYLPKEKIVATGDIVVLPTPYGFGSYPTAWAQSIRELKGLDYDLLVPGHGEPQTDDAYLDLLIETFETVAAQMAALVAQGVGLEEAKGRMDFTKVQARFTGGDSFLDRLFEIWFKTPISEAAWKVASGQSPEIP